MPVVSVLITGMYIRTRRLYVGELRDRAEWAERGREERARVAVAEESYVSCTTPSRTR